MIVVLDPVFFVLNGPDAAEEQRIAEDLRLIREFLDATNGALLLHRDLTGPMWQQLIQPLSRLPSLKVPLTELRKRLTPRTLPPTPARLKVWGFRQLFDGQPGLDAAWTDRMSKVLAQAASTGEETVLLARLRVNRNLRRHQSQDSTLDEPTRWRLLLRASGWDGPRSVYCVQRRRHVDQPWTTRFDHRLPCEADGATYPFCPPDDWRSSRRAAVKTHLSKPAFIDALGHAWARPNISSGAGYHWDVFLPEGALTTAIGLDQLNIVAFGAPTAELAPGSVHHTPAKKESKFNDKARWRCC
ncbi:hypothetical protein L6R46_10970 [Myxococcota bacterium]|nr:hypothetical protein [Myxococcota bacterium]